MHTPLNELTANQLIEKYIGTAYDTVKAVVANEANINAAAGVVAAIDTVSTDIANINLVATNIANVNTTATNIANVNTAATNIANINTVATDITNVNITATDIANVNLVATDIANVNTVASGIANVNTVVSGIANINTVATDITNVNLVATDIANVNTVALSLADINYIATNFAALQTVVTNIAAIVAATDLVRLRYWAPETRLDGTSPGEIKVINGQTIHELANGEIAHFGDGYIPITSLTEARLDVLLQMETSEASKNIKLTTRVYDNSNTLIRTAVYDDLSVPNTLETESSIQLATIFNDTDFASNTEGRIEIELGAATTSPHSGQVQLKKVEIVYV